MGMILKRKPLDPALEAAVKEYQFRQKLNRMRNKICFVEGPKGRGKSTFLVAASYSLREMGKGSVNDKGIWVPAKDPPHVLILGTSLGIDKDAYGPFSFMSEAAFIEALHSFNELAEAEAGAGFDPAGDQSEAVRRKLMDLGLINAIWVLDEAYKMLEAHTSGTKMVRVFGYVISAIRHYRNTLLIAAPKRRMAVNRVRDQVDYWVRANNDCNTQFDWEGKPHCVAPGCQHIVTTVFRDSRGEELPWKMRWSGPRWWPLYYSWNTVGIRASQLENVKI